MRVFEYGSGVTKQQFCLRSKNGDRKLDISAYVIEINIVEQTTPLWKKMSLKRKTRKELMLLAKLIQDGSERIYMTRCLTKTIICD